jgi:hypothetical protein
MQSTWPPNHVPMPPPNALGPQRVIITHQVFDLAMIRNPSSTTNSIVCNSLQPFANQQLGSSWPRMQYGVNVSQGNTQLLGQVTIATMTTQGKDIGYVSIGDLSTQLDSQVVSSNICSKQTKQKAKHEVMDKVMKRLGIKIVLKNGTNVTHVVKCNVEGNHVGGGMNKWLSQLRGYAMKLNLAIDDIRKQPTPKL